MASSAFYKLINALSDVKFESNASDFFAISRNVAAVLKENYREKVRFLRGYVQNVGFPKTTIDMKREQGWQERASTASGNCFIFCEYHRLLFQSAVEAGNLCRDFCRIFRTCGTGLYAVYQKWCTQRLCNDRYPELFYVCVPVSDRWHYW